MEVDPPTTTPTSYIAPLPADLARVTATSSAASAAGLETVSGLIAQLESARARIANRENPNQQLTIIKAKLKGDVVKVDKQHKEWASAIKDLGKTVDKKFSTPLELVFPPPASEVPPPSVQPTLLSLTTTSTNLSSSSTLLPQITTPAPFTSPAAIAALNQTIALHLARIGAFTTLNTFLAESDTPQVAEPLLDALRGLHHVLRQLAEGDVSGALGWIEERRTAGKAVDGDGELEFALRKEHFVRLLLVDQAINSPTEAEAANPFPTHPPTNGASSLPPQSLAALTYGGLHFKPLVTPPRLPTISALLCAPLFLPFARLLASPYGPLFAEYLPPASSPAGGERAVAPPTARLQAQFAAAFLRTIGLPRESPLSVVTDVGGGGALARIQKVRNVMKEKRTEWSAKGELPVEIPLPSEYKFHSIFACPVSKEQATEQNPPMLLPCGHVIARESLNRLARGTSSVKCPYCPIVSNTTSAVRVHF